MSAPPSDNKYLCIDWFRIKLYLHWSTPALGLTAALLATSASGSLSAAVFFSTLIAFILLVAVHELGHAAAAKFVGVRIDGIVLAGTGGWCLLAHAEPLGPRARLAIYSGGLLAQAFLFGATVLALFVFGAPSHLALTCAVIVFTAFNVLLMCISGFARHGNDGEFIAQAVRELLRRDA
jgi:hypothetical protein